jgi:hypothetical protein
MVDLGDKVGRTQRTFDCASGPPKRCLCGGGSVSGILAIAND